MPNNPPTARNRAALGIALLAVIGMGLATRKFADALPGFIANHGGDALWTVAVYLALAIVSPRTSPLKLGLLAFGISVAVEFSQLIDIAWLNGIRATLPGRLLLGSGFLWIDLARYFVGAAMAVGLDWLWARAGSSRASLIES